MEEMVKSRESIVQVESPSQEATNDWICSSVEEDSLISLEMRHAACAITNGDWQVFNGAKRKTASYIINGESKGRFPLENS